MFKCLNIFKKNKNNIYENFLLLSKNLSKYNYKNISTIKFFSRRNIKLEQNLQSSKIILNEKEEKINISNNLQNNENNLSNKKSTIYDNSKSKKNYQSQLNQQDNTLNNKDLKESNLYLQILSSLSKIENTDRPIFAKRLISLCEKSNISNLDDKSILDLIISEELATEKNKEEINNLIEEEVSEEEFASEKGIRFRRPPHTLDELKKTLEEADEIYEKNKVKFLGQTQKDYEEIENNFIKDLPKHLKMNVLSYPSNDSDIVLIGANRFSNIHALWISDFLDKYEPDGIGIEFHPDDPIFIEGKFSHLNEWKNFISKNVDYKFKVNPLPKNVMDVLLTPNKVESLIQNNIDKCMKMKLTPKLIFTDQSNFFNNN